MRFLETLGMFKEESGEISLDELERFLKYKDSRVVSFKYKTILDIPRNESNSPVEIMRILREARANLSLRPNGNLSLIRRIYIGDKKEKHYVDIDMIYGMSSFLEKKYDGKSLFRGEIKYEMKN